MHEVSLLQSALEIAEEHAHSQDATRIHTMTLRIGRLAGVEPEALSFAWEMVTLGTMAEGARLDVVNVAVLCFCPECDEEFAPDGDIFACPRCGHLTSQVRCGMEMELASLEVS